MRWASVTVSPHPLQPKASLCSLGQSSSRPSRNKCSPHPPHSRTIRPDASTQRSSPSPCQDSSDDCMSFIPSCPSFFMAALIEPAIQSIDTGGPHEPLGLPPPYDPGGAAIGPTHPHRNHLFRPTTRST